MHMRSGRMVDFLESAKRTVSSLVSRIAAFKPPLNMEPANARATCGRWLVLIPLILFAYVSLSTICVHCVIYRYLIMINTSAKGIFYALENHWFFVWFIFR